MNRLVVVALSITALATAAPSGSRADGPYYARGNFYCSSSLAGTAFPDSCYGYGPELQLFDDGDHGDGAAADGVYGGSVACNQGPGLLFFKIANADWSFSGPNAPGEPFVNARLFTTEVGEVVHFRLDLAAPEAGWEPPIAFANDHGYPAGASLEVIGSAPELGNWNFGLMADHLGPIWQKKVTIATPGTYEYKFRVVGSWLFANFGLHYNNNMGANGSFTTTEPDVSMLIQFDESTGRIRAVPNDDVPVVGTSWGLLKALYR